MTFYLPLDASSTFPQSPHFLVPSPEPTAHLQKAVRAILKAKRVAVVCGAGISVQAGIPDFRSETGLFQTLKKDHSSLSSGKDLFDASVFNSEATTSLFCQMIAQLARLSQTAQPTAFHHLLRALDDRGRLLRVYTQNIDALELKTGLTFGVPEVDSRRPKPRSMKGKSDQPGPSIPSSSSVAPRLPTPPAETPRCIPLHGTIQYMHCQICLHSFPLENYLDDLNAGSFPICPECNQIEETRQAVGKRSRGVGKLRPSVVLYNEVHKDGEEVGEVVERDLVGNSKGKGRAGADLLLVVGTSLRVPGTKRMVREFSKAVHSRSLPIQNESSTSSSSSSTCPLPSPRRTPTAEEDAPIKTIYLNLDFPVPTREWDGVFDVWIRGDAQTFANVVQEEIEKEERAKEAAVERKKRREEMKEEAAREEKRQRQEAEAMANVKGKKKCKPQSKAPVSSGRKRKEAPGLLTPPRTVKKQKIYTHSSPHKSPHKKSKNRTGISEQKLTIRIPPRSRPAPSATHRSYSPPTPPPSQRTRLVPEVVMNSPHKARMISHSQTAPDASPPLMPPRMYFSASPPLSTPPSTPPCRPTSPLTPCSSSSSAFSSPLTSILSSPVCSPLSSPPLTPLGSPLLPVATPVRRRRRSMYKPSSQVVHAPPDNHLEDEVVDIEGDSEGMSGISPAKSSFPPSLSRRMTALRT